MRGNDNPGGAASYETAALRIQTLGGFRVWREGVEVDPTEWGREKAVHLLQFFVTLRRKPLHKEEIIDRLWPDLDSETGNRDFKVALSITLKTLEPDRAPRAQSRFIRRYDLAYGLNLETAQVDADEFESFVEGGNHALARDVVAAIEKYQRAIALYTGEYLPERRYEDWSSAERERLQTLALGTMTALAKLLLDSNPLESLRLTQRVLALDSAWEEAYRIQMKAHLAQGNRALALRVYQQCLQALADEFGIEPLPETQDLHNSIRG